MPRKYERSAGSLPVGRLRSSSVANDLYTLLPEVPDSAKRSHNAKDRTDERHGKWVVIRRHSVAKYQCNGRTIRCTRWLCRCDCGSERVILTPALLKGSGSCGCAYKKPKTTCPRRLPPGRGARNTFLSGYRHAARKRGLAWELDDAAFDALVLGDCHYCGAEPSVGRKSYCYGKASGTFICNGIDRLDSSDGYVAGNVVSCCSICNHAKKDMPYETFLAWLAKAAAFQAAKHAF